MLVPNTRHNTDNQHSGACNYLPPYTLDLLKIVEYIFSCEMEEHVSDNKEEAL